MRYRQVILAYEPYRSAEYWRRHPLVSAGLRKTGSSTGRLRIAFSTESVSCLNGNNLESERSRYRVLRSYRASLIAHSHVGSGTGVAARWRRLSRSDGRSYTSFPSRKMGTSSSSTRS